MAAHSDSFQAPSSILIIGSGVFGLSTAYSLCKNPQFKNTSITLVDRQPFPAPDGSSIDTSRIIRPDYACTPYSTLAAQAQNLWRTTFAPQYYFENGLCLTADASSTPYVLSSLENVRSLATCEIEVLQHEQDIKRVCGVDNASGSTGYLNRSSGWADAEGAMRWLRHEVERYNRVHFLTSTVSKLLFNHHETPATVSGAILADGSTLTADLTVLAAGAWSPALLDLRGICKATGQVLCYLPVCDAQQARLEHKPTLLNMSTGLFLLPPRNNVLKVARHGHGYANPTTIPHPESTTDASSTTTTVKEQTITVSLPHTAIDDPHQAVPPEGQRACRAFLSTLHPSLAPTSPSRPFSKTRICWYADTPRGDFLISYHPTYKGLFVATGGSGHGFKFLPVIGDRIVECVMGRAPEAFRERWAWPERRVPEEEWEGDGSRGGPVGMVLAEEMAKGDRGKL